MDLKEKLRACAAIALGLLAPLAHTALADEIDLKAAYNSIRAEATKIAGDPLDMPRRATFLYEIYQDSGGNHAFPLVALHGALWGYKFFEVTGPIGDEIVKRYFYDPAVMEHKKEEIHTFSLSFQETNRSVFIDTYTNYYFTKQYGNVPGADQFVNPNLLKALNLVHEARRENRRLSDQELSNTFRTALYYEQELTVGPRVREAVEAFDCPFLKFFALKPAVRFEYFPPNEVFLFKDFSNQQERIKKATRAYDIAVQVGWDTVKSTIKNYNVVDPAFFDDPESFIAAEKAQIFAQPASSSQ